MGTKIVFVTPFPDSAGAAAEMTPKGFDITVAAKGTPEYEAAIGDAEYLVGFVAGLIKQELFEQAPKLKLIQLLSAGYDEADVDAAIRAQVPVANNGGANSVAVSEHAILLALACLRRLNWQHASVSAGQWRGNQTPRVHEMRGKTVGIIGLGSIGKKTARLAQAFGVNLIYYDIARLTEAEEDALNVRFRLKNEVLRESDVVSVHTPLNESTRHMIGAEELAMMKASAILVNTARGPVIDESIRPDVRWVRHRSTLGPLPRWGLVLVVVLIGLLVGYRMFMDWVNDQMTPSDLPGVEVEFTIVEGWSTNDVVASLGDVDVIDNPAMFRQWMRCPMGIRWLIDCEPGVEYSFQAGDYVLQEHLSFEATVDLLNLGPLPEEVIRVTVPEGMTLEQMVTR